MIITTIAAALTMGLATFDDVKPLTCLIMGGPVRDNTAPMEYAGSLYGFCCPGCDTKFAADPKAAMKKHKDGKQTVAAFLFDPITHKRIKSKAAKASADYQGTRYYFSSEENKAKFEANSKKYAKVPAKESLTCAVMGTKIKTYSKADSYTDVDGVRYYHCCAVCVKTMAKDAKKYAGKNVGAPAVITVKS
ncbi:MAG: YHS domain-containing protein [Armatimonadetes bacterium]|nr:YHS domain-containing protein [Armatimonadota bacterium]